MRHTLTILFFLTLCSMKRRRPLLSLPLLPTITETLEDLPVYPSSPQSTQSFQSLEDYMTSIQALARPVETPSCGPVRLQKSPRLRQFSKAQMKLSVSASLPRGSPRTLRTSRHYSLSLNSTEDYSLKMGREKDCRGKDPIDWLFGQIRTWRETLLLLWDAKGATQSWKNLLCLSRKKQCNAWWDLLWWLNKDKITMSEWSEDLFISMHRGLKSTCLQCFVKM